MQADSFQLILNPVRDTSISLSQFEFIIKQYLYQNVKYLASRCHVCFQTRIDSAHPSLYTAWDL